MLVVWLGGDIMCIIVGVVQAVMGLVVDRSVLIRGRMMTAVERILVVVLLLGVALTVVSREVNRIGMPLVVSVRMMLIVLCVIMTMDLKRMILPIVMVMVLMIAMLFTVIVSVRVRIVMHTVLKLAGQVVKALAVDSVAKLMLNGDGVAIIVRVEMIEGGEDSVLMILVRSVIIPMIIMMIQSVE